MKSIETVEELSRQGMTRLYPRLTDPNYLILRRRRELFQQWLKRLPGNNLRVLDVGGRIQPYRPLIQNRVSRYLAVDLRRTALVDVVARAEALSLASDCFDLVFCSQVLEYIPNPGAAIAEIHRVLKPGGFLFLSLPAICLRDSDEECWRFLPFGIRWLLAPFSQVELAPEGGSIVGFVRTVNVGLFMFARYSTARKVFGYTICPMLNWLGMALEVLAPSENDQFSANFSAIARK